MAERFPDQTAETIGQFQVVSDSHSEDSDSAAKPRTGVLRFVGNAFELEVSPGFNPVVNWTTNRRGALVGRPQQKNSVTANAVVLGATAIQPGEVTLWGVRVLRRQMLGFPSPSEDEPRSREVLSAEWCFVGALFPDRETRFNAVALDITGLHAFAAMPSIYIELPERGMIPMRWVYDPPATAAGTTPTPTAGQVKFEPRASIPSINGPDVSVATDTRLRVQLGDSVSLSTVLSDIAIPVATLLTILHGSECKVRRLNVSVPDGDSADVYGHDVDPSAPSHSNEETLLTLDDAGGPDFVGRWLELWQKVSPVPQILAASYAEEFATVEAEAINLCIAAENLHRRLYPDQRRWDNQTVDDAMAGLEDAPIPSEVRTALLQALDQYLFEPSFPMRIEMLATRVGKAVPECVGRINRWKQAVTNQRNNLAHGLPAEAGSQQLEIHTITRTLRWVLTLHLLLDAGVPDDRLADAVQASSRFERDQQSWRRAWPRIFADPRQPD